MKRVFAAALFLVLLFFLLPTILVGDTPPASALPDATPPAASSPSPSDGAASLDQQVSIRLQKEDGTVETISMDKYLLGVVAAEMPAAFEVEALKAQAVAARTYAYARCTSSSPAHPDADLCTSYACCQAYLTDAEQQANWGENTASYQKKIADAVTSTDGQVILYDNEPIRAVFFSSASGRTNDAMEVWGSEVPYLTGVETPEGNEVPNFQTTVTFSPSEFQTTFLAQYPEADLSGAPSAWFGAPEYASSGCVAAIPIGGVRVTGPDLRTLLGLRSARFSVSAADSAITFTVTGYGHGVGMSQYGANAMAKSGSTYREILTHYYTGVSIAPYPDL